MIRQSPRETGLVSILTSKREDCDHGIFLLSREKQKEKGSFSHSWEEGVWNEIIILQEIMDFIVNVQPRDVRAGEVNTGPFSSISVAPRAAMLGHPEEG